jgi:hypothetical protein
VFFKWVQIRDAINVHVDLPLIGISQPFPCGEELLKTARVSLFRSRANAMGSRAANQANRRMTDTIVSICKAYKDWQSEHGLLLGDVPEIPEHLEDGHLTTNERE